MCLSPVKILSNSRYYNFKNGHKLYHYVPCGHCIECQHAKINEYIGRSNIECHECSQTKGGAFLGKTFREKDYLRHKKKNDNKIIGGTCYTYMETLTYNEKIVPKFHGMNVFSRKDIMDFLKRLRQNLIRKGYFTINEKNEKYVNMKYFITSEYGHTTHRPHYHILFHIYQPNLDPFTLYHSIFDTWQKGILDEFDKNGGRHYANDKVVDGITAAAYVSKYLCKDDEFVSCLRQKLNELRQNYIDEHKHDKDFSLEKANSLFHENSHYDIMPFHMQSQGYGIALTKQFNSIYNDNCVIIPDRRLGKRKIPVPQYIRRKLFYELKQTPIGKTWRLNELGKTWLLNIHKKRYDALVNRYNDIICNLVCYIPDGEKRKKFQSFYDNFIKKYNFYDFCNYIYYYKNRLFDSVEKINSDWCESCDFAFYDDYSFDNNIDLYKLKKSLSKQQLDNYLADLSHDYHLNNFYPQFSDFDKLFDLFHDISSDYDAIRQEHLKADKKIRNDLKLKDIRYVRKEKLNLIYRKQILNNITYET